MGKKLKITESQLKMLVENKNRKIVSEQPERELEQNPIGELSNDFHIARKDEHGILYLLRSKRSKEYGVFNKSKMDWEHGYQPSFTDTDTKLYETQNGDYVIIEKYTGIDDKSFYTLHEINPANDGGIVGIVKFLNTREHVDLVKNLKDIDTSNDSLPPSEDMRKRNNDKVYEESDMDEEIDGPSKEEYFAKHGEDNMGWTGSSNKTYDNLPDGDYDDMSYDDFDTLHNEYPDFHKHYSGSNIGLDHARRIFDLYKNSKGPLRMKRMKNMDEMGMEEDGMMNESIKQYKTDFDSYLKGPKQ